MPNRIIKESICTSDSLSRLSWFEQSLFFRLIVTVDDFGRFDARPAVLRGRLFPLQSVTEKQISDGLVKISTAGMVDLYEVGGKPFLQLTSWNAHQAPRAKASKYPAPGDSCKHLQADEIICKQMQANVPDNENDNENDNIGVRSALDVAMDEFAKHRSRMRKPMTDRARQLILNDLDKLAPGDEEAKIAIIDQSIKNGWQGVFALKTEPKEEKAVEYYRG